MSNALVMLGEQNEVENSIIIRIPDDAIVDKCLLKVSKKEALEIIANLAVQVALSD